MKKAVIFSWAVMFLLATGALAAPIGVGVVVGPVVPIVQADQGTGFAYGLKARLHLAEQLILEPNLTLGGYGETTIAGVGTRDGSSVTHYGVDLVIGGGMASIGPKPLMFIGGGIYNVKRDGDVTVNKTGWSFGLGLAVGFMSTFDIDLRGRVNIVASEGSASKKSAEITAGATYYFGS